MAARRLAARRLAARRLAARRLAARRWPEAWGGRVWLLDKKLRVPQPL